MIHSFFFATLFACLASTLVPQALADAPGKIYGVNLGSWLVIEPWLMPQAWADMGGESCVCEGCISGEWALGKAYPDSIDQKLEAHWESWFTQSDVDTMKQYGLNTVRIPVGFWIVEPIVDYSTEFYAKGGIKQLKRGLSQLKAAGISAILEHHALPGVQTPNSVFTGQCTQDAQFYTDANYHRALIWTAVMTAITHLDPDFGSVFAIQAVNEPIMDASQTPGFGDFQVNFVKVMRAVETALGMQVPSSEPGFQSITGDTCWSSNVTAAILEVANNFGGDEISKVLIDSAPVLTMVMSQLDESDLLFNGPSMTSMLTTNQMDVNWQYNNPNNPADAAIGSQIYDNHIYYTFGGVAAPNPDAYMSSICNLNRVGNDASVGNDPLFFGEWSLSTEFDADDDFLGKFADAQKLVYSKGKGWIFWNFKTESSATGQGWSYFEGVEKGYFTTDPSQLQDPSVCDQYIS